MIGKGAVRSARVSLHTITVVNCFLISFIHMPAKMQKPLELLLEGGGKNDRVTHV